MPKKVATSNLGCWQISGTFFSSPPSHLRLQPPLSDRSISRKILRSGDEQCKSPSLFSRPNWLNVTILTIQYYIYAELFFFPLVIFPSFHRKYNGDIDRPYPGYFDFITDHVELYFPRKCYTQERGGFGKRGGDSTELSPSKGSGRGGGVTACSPYQGH